MSLLVTAPEFLTTAASDLANLGTTINTAVATAAAPTTQVLAPAADEVSAQIVNLFGAHGQLYQALSARAAAFHDQFVRALGAGAASYVAAEAANASPLQSVEQAVQGLVSAPAQTLLGNPLIGGGAPGGAGATAAAAGLIGAGEARVVAGLPAAVSPLGLQQGLGNLVGSLTTDFANLTGGVSAAAGLNLASLPGPIGQWGNVITATWTNLQQIGMEIQADPLPILAQVVHNQIGFANAAGSDLQQLWTGVQPYVQQQLPQDLQTLFSGVLAGNISSSVNNFNADLLAGLLPALNPIDQLLQIPGQMSQNYTNVLSDNLPGIGLELMLAPLGPALGSFQATADALQVAHDAWFAGQPLAALVDLMNVPAVGTGAFLNGYQTQYDIGYTGLLTSAESPLGVPGLVDNLVVQIPQQIATTLAGGGPTATWGENFNDLSSIISSGLGSLF